MLIHFTEKSRNAKTGNIPVSTSSDTTFPDACPLKGSGACYAGSGPLAMHWRAVSNGDRGDSFARFVAKISILEPGTLWRHNQAGDLPGTNNTIDAVQMRALVAANKKAGARGFTYTHKPVSGRDACATKNRQLVREANRKGFTVNLSADNLAEADALKKLNAGPVVTIAPRNAPAKFTTPGGNKAIVCPAQTRDDVTCKTCGLCAVAERDVIVAFKAHGAGAAKAERIFMMQQAL